MKFVSSTIPFYIHHYHVPCLQLKIAVANHSNQPLLYILNTLILSQLNVLAYRIHIFINIKVCLHQTCVYIDLCGRESIITLLALLPCCVWIQMAFNAIWLSHGVCLVHVLSLSSLFYLDYFIAFVNLQHTPSSPLVEHLIHLLNKVLIGWPQKFLPHWCITLSLLFMPCFMFCDC